MFTSHSACPTAENPPCVPGTYYVQHPPLEPVPVCAFAGRLSQATAKARDARQTGLDTYHRNALTDR